MHRFHPKHSSHLHRINMFSDVNLNCNSLMYLWVQSCYSQICMIYCNYSFFRPWFISYFSIFFWHWYDSWYSCSSRWLISFCFYRPLDRFMNCNIIDCILIRLTVVVYLIRLGVLWQIFVWLWWLLIFLF